MGSNCELASSLVGIWQNCLNGRLRGSRGCGICSYKDGLAIQVWWKGCGFGLSWCSCRAYLTLGAFGPNFIAIIWGFTTLFSCWSLRRSFSSQIIIFCPSNLFIAVSAAIIVSVFIQAKLAPLALDSLLLAVLSWFYPFVYRNFWHSHVIDSYLPIDSPHWN